MTEGAKASSMPWLPPGGPVQSTSAGGYLRCVEWSGLVKQRVISSILGLAILAVVLFFFDTLLLNAAVAVICFMAMYEMINAIGAGSNRLLAAVGCLVAVVIPFIPRQREMDLLPVFLLPYIFVLFCILLRTHSTTRVDQVALVFLTSLGIPLSLSCAVYMRDHHSTAVGIFYVILSLGGAWLSDSGAYFAGRAFGRHKLCPLISPNKTVEGAVGGLLTCVVLYAVIAFGFQLAWRALGYQIQVNYLRLLLIAPFASVISVLGDLSASVIKRQYQVKDFGNIMPGHGGVLDRFDSVLFVVPFVYIMTVFLPVCNVL